MKNKTTKKEIRQKKKSGKEQKDGFHHCQYCDKRTPIGVETCGNCARKRELVHRLWLIGQLILADAGRLNREKRTDMYE